MISWEGRFSWQGYAAAGRPDFLNYLNAGDVSWEELWQFYGQTPASPEAVRSLTRLFHLFLSSRYDAAGCWLDPEGEVAACLRAWAEFALDAAERLTLEEVQGDLAGMVGGGITPLYYEAAYLVFMETSVDRHASAWDEGRAEAPPDAWPELPAPDERCLPVYHPGPDRFSHLQGDASWDAALRSLVSEQYASWNRAFSAHLPDADHEEEWTTAGGEG